MAEKKKKKASSSGGLEPLGSGSDIGKAPKFSENSFPDKPAPDDEPKRGPGRPRKFSEGALGQPSRAEKLKGWGSTGKRDVYRAGRFGLNTANRNIQRGGMALNQLSGSVKGAVPFGSTVTGMFRTVGSIFVLAWNQMSMSMKALIALAFFVAILFVPWGLFYYAGWAIAAAVMFLISLIYWVFANLFNAIASGLIAVINGVATIFMGVIVRIVEGILSLLFVGGWSGYGWQQGRDLMNHALLPYSSIATPPNLMNIQTPHWQPFFNTTLIAKLFEHIPGLQAFADSFNKYIGQGIGDAFAGFVSTAPGWEVILVGLIPVYVVVGVLIFFYYKNREHLQQYY